MSMCILWSWRDNQGQDSLRARGSGQSPLAGDCPMMGIAHHPEDRKCRCNLFKFRKWCILVHEHMGSGSRCALQVSFQDGCTLVGRNLFEVTAESTWRKRRGLSSLHLFPGTEQHGEDVDVVCRWGSPDPRREV